MSRRTSPTSGPSVSQPPGRPVAPGSLPRHHLPTPGGRAAVRHLARLDSAGLPGSPGGDLRVPSLLALDDGTLLLVHDHRPPVPGPGWQQDGGALPGDLPNPNSLWLRRSTDAGASWSAPQPLVPDPGCPLVRGLSDPSLLLAADGTVHLLAAAATDVGLFGAHPPTRPAAPGQPAESGTLRLLHARSQDGGRTWAWQDLSDLLRPSAQDPAGLVAFPVSGHGATLGAGPWPGLLVQPLVAVGPPRPDGSRPVQARSLLSDDAGASWYLGQPVPPPSQAATASLAGAAATTGVDEWALAPAPDGSLLLCARDGGYGGTRLTSRSHDGGRSWSVPQPRPDLPDPGCNGALLALPGTRALLCSHAADPRARRQGRLSLSTDAGATWRPLAELSGPQEPFGYSDLCALPGPGHRVLVVAEEPQDGAGAVLVLQAVDLGGLDLDSWDLGGLETGASDSGAVDQSMPDLEEVDRDRTDLPAVGVAGEESVEKQRHGQEPGETPMTAAGAADRTGTTGRTGGVAAPGTSSQPSPGGGR